MPEPGDPQALNRYAYVYNNPLRYTDPSGHFAQVVGGFLLGAGLAYGVQVIANLRAGMRVDQALIQVCDVSMLAGGVVGAVGAATFGASLAVLGAATGVEVTAASAGGVGVAMAAGVISGRAVQVAANVVGGREWGEGLWDPSAMVLDAVTAGAIPGLRALQGKVAPFVEGRIQRHLRAVVSELKEDSMWAHASPSRIGQEIHRQVARRMRAEGIRGLHIEPEIPGGRPDYWFEPENIIWDIKPRGGAFVQEESYRRWSRGKVRRIDYDPWWR